MIWFLRRRSAAEEARKRSKAAAAQQSQQSSLADDWSMNPANPMSITSTLNPMHAAGNSPSNDQVSSPDCPPSHDNRNYDTGSSGFTDGGNSCGDLGGGGSSFDSGGGSN
jgi:type II secretory pathway pseudopilin PulG